MNREIPIGELKISEGQQKTTPPPDVLHSEAEARPSILVVDDDDDTRTLLRRVLENEYTVRTAINGLEAVEALKGWMPDLVVSDVMMPFADGYDLLSALRSEPSTRDLPVILLSARADGAERTRGLEHGAQDYIAKPLDISELRARVRIQLRLAESRRSAETQIRELTDRLVTEQDNERRRIGRDIHDQIGQQLTALRLQLELLKSISREAKLVERIEQTQDIATQLDSDIDFLTWELHSTTFESVDIVGSLANYVSEWSKRFGVPANFQIFDLDQTRLAPDAKTNVYRIVQESLHNISKHSQARHATVSMEGGAAGVTLLVEDDGVGFDTDDLAAAKPDHRGIGLQAMRERASLIGADLTIQSKPGSGTTIRIIIPANRASSAS